MLLSALIGGSSSVQATESLLPNVNHTIEQIQALTAQRSSIELIFQNVVSLAEDIEKINTDIAKSIGKVTPREFNYLRLINHSISFAFQYLKQHYQPEIFAHYQKEFRLLSNSKNRFENQLKHIRENLYGVEIVSVKDLSLSERELNEMMVALSQMKHHP